jgi:Holliday junction DNA helicase RuvA
MIGYLKGKLAFKDPTFVIIDVNGVGYEVKISLYTFSKIKNQESCMLHTHLHVKEDSQTLFGFSEVDEKSIFLQLIGISGVGPNTALMINSSLTVDEIKSAIVNEQVNVIQKVKGIGSKTAHRIILELKDKIKRAGYEDSASVVVSSSKRNEALSALITLGINRAMAEKGVDKILDNHGDDISLEDLIKQVLKQA